MLAGLTLGNTAWGLWDDVGSKDEFGAFFGCSGCEGVGQFRASAHLRRTIAWCLDWREAVYFAHPTHAVRGPDVRFQTLPQVQSNTSHISIADHAGFSKSRHRI